MNEGVSFSPYLKKFLKESKTGYKTDHLITLSGGYGGCAVESLYDQFTNIRKWSVSGKREDDPEYMRDLSIPLWRDTLDKIYPYLTQMEEELIKVWEECGKKVKLWKDILAPAAGIVRVGPSRIYDFLDYITEEGERKDLLDSLSESMIQEISNSWNEAYAKAEKAEYAIVKKYISSILPYFDYLGGLHDDTPDARWRYYCSLRRENGKDE